MAKRMIFAKQLYLDEAIESEKIRGLKRKLLYRPQLCGHTVIAISQNPHDQLDLYPVRQLKQKYYEKNPLYVIGISKNYEGAVKIVEKIVMECLDSRGDCALKEYLKCKYS